jgi:hypothetical protein
MSFSKVCMMVLPPYHFHRQRSHRPSHHSQRPLQVTVNNNPIHNEKSQVCTGAQKWFVNNDKRKKKKKTRTAIPITVVSVYAAHDISISSEQCRDTRQRKLFEDYSDDEESVSSNFSNTAACCGDTAETYNV